MASQTNPTPHGLVSAVVDPAFWPQQLSDSSSLALHFSPTASSATQESVNGSTPPAHTPKSDTSQRAPRAQGNHGEREQPAQQAQPAIKAVAVACVPCRTRHLKCHGGVRCSRCRDDGLECTYIKSRRGWKGKRKPKTGGQGDDGLSAQSIPGQIVNGNGTLLVSPVNTTLPTSTLPLQSPEYSFTDALTKIPAYGLATTSQYNLDGSSRALQNGANAPRDAFSAFFYYFYNSHPFVLPQPRLLQLFQERRAPLLELAVQYVGSSFLPAVPTSMYEEALERALLNQTYPKDGYSLQALLLYSIGLHANDRTQRAAQVFALAQALTIELGVHRREFAPLNSNGDRVLEESWRRTWWSMYVSNGMMAAVNPGVQFRLKDVALEVPLPCEDERYFSGLIPLPNTIEDYDDDAFSGAEPTIFSSFTYLIDAIRILGRVFEVARLDSTFEYHAVDVVDTNLSTWRVNLPPCKRNIISNDGTVDEVLFQAHMVHNGSTIMLHRPRSNLGFGVIENVNVCVQPGQVLLPTQTREIHTGKCLTSAENIAALIKLPCPLINHTPFFTCVVVMASVVHLSYWSFLVPDGEDDVIKQSIRLDVGTLQQYSLTWPIAGVVLGQVRGVAHTLWNSKKAMNIHLWSNLAQDDIIRNVIEEGGHEPLENYSRLIAPMLRS
ncbi:uncharacterized protein EI97DRAFT_461068 [Westerdykella ornata]|uniref:Zn(2)-C6 fungal-type domain-containing protein n=1 Tax=Westerdykella ornata TaxID=318751 RepID=A0A6A6J9Z6_WESOR|nr:uncharacterized protein EI97DRAFT_461068 [Westerdykella ornata]KAF2273401.1 hypothetical protein EI97DRAFT_461068 [Westerdykella ornata]